MPFPSTVTPHGSEKLPNAVPEPLSSPTCAPDGPKSRTFVPLVTYRLPPSGPPELSTEACAFDGALGVRPVIWLLPSELKLLGAPSESNLERRPAPVSYT